MNALTPRIPATIREARLDDPAERDRIDSFVRAASDAQPFHRPQWSQGVERGCRQRSHYLLAEGKGGRIEGVLPLSAIRSPIFGSALVSTGFGVSGGILADDGATAEALADAAWSLAGTLRCPTLELRGGRLPAGWPQQQGVYANFARALPPCEADILGTIPRRQRAEIRRGLGHEMSVAIGRGEADRAAHYRVYCESVHNHGTPVFPRNLFDAMMDAFGDDADILTVRKDGTPIASVLSLYFKNIVYLYWGGGTRAARHWRANEVAYYELMRHAHRRGCTRFDFGRSKVGTGAFAFKKNWGFIPEPMTYALRTKEGTAPRDINPLHARYRLQVAAWKKLPLWLANRIGPPIARGLG